MNEEQRLVRKRLRILEHAQKTGNVHKTCRYFGIARSSFYRCKCAVDREGESGPIIDAVGIWGFQFIAFLPVSGE